MEMSLLPCMFLINEFQECTAGDVNESLTCRRPHVCFHSQLGDVLTTQPLPASAMCAGETPSD